MATESVKILIEAEDKATAQLQKAVREQEKVAAKSALIKQQQEQALTAERIALEQGAEAAEAYRLTIQGLDADTARLIAREKALVQEQKQANAELAKQPSGLKSTKATTEFFGAVAGMAGGSQIASVASQLAGLTEKTGQFSEVAKQGGSSAMLFKAGLVAAAGAIGFQVGKAIGDVVFQTEKWNTELEKAVAKLNKLEQVKLNNISSEFENFKTDEIELNLGGEEGATAAIEDRIALLNEEIKTKTDQRKATESSLKAMQDEAAIDWSNSFGLGQFEESLQYAQSFTGEHKATVEQKKLQITQDQAQLELYQQQKQELENILSVEKEREEKRQIIAGDQYIEGLKNQLADLNAELDGTTNQLQAMVNTANGEQSGVALALLDDIKKVNDELQKQAKEKSEAEAAAKKEEDAIKRINDLRKSEIDRLKEQAIALAESKEAAHAFRLEKQGLSADDAKAIAAEQARIDELNAAKNKKADKQQSLQAVESRLLTRGPEQDPTAKNTAEIARLAKQQLEKLNKIAAKTDNQPAKSTQLELVSR